jgi:hypothetical protein
VTSQGLRGLRSSIRWVAWVQGWLYDRLDRREARRVRIAGWSQTGVDTWFVQLDESAAKPDPSQRTATVTLTVRGKDGQPHPTRPIGCAATWRTTTA